MVKKELEFNIKFERIDADAMYSTEVFKIAGNSKCDDCRKKQIEINELVAEKQNLADNLIQTKKDHQQTFMDVQKKDRKIRKMRRELTTAKKKLIELQSKCTILMNELETTKHMEQANNKESKDDSEASSDIFEVEKNT